MYLSIHRGVDRSLSTQIYTELRTKIVNTELEGGFRLPSSRDLAGDLGVSRNVVVSAYDQLLAEGYIESRTGDGTYVLDGFGPVSPEEEPLHSDLVSAPSMTLSGFDSTCIDFRSGLPDLSLFPRRQWLHHYKSLMEELSPVDLAYGPPEGRSELRQSIADYLRTARGLHCDPRQVIITSGTTQAISLVTRLLLNNSHKKDVILEDPITADINRIIELNGGRCHSVPIDDRGLNPSDIPDSVNPGFCYVTPSHHFPLGGTMEVRRRLRLIDYAKEKNCYILEDDYDSEFRFDVQPLQPLYELDRSRVIYCGTFSKTLFPALRTAYLILPAALLEKGRRLKWYADLHNATLDQLTLARFIKSGEYVRHIGRMKKRYKSRRASLLRAINQHFGDSAAVRGVPAGLHFCVRFEGQVFDRPRIDEIRSRGVILYPVSDHTPFPEGYSDTLIFGYGMLPVERMEEGISILKNYLQKPSSQPAKRKETIL